MDCESVRGYNHTVLVPENQFCLRHGVYAVIINCLDVLLVPLRSSGLLFLPGGGVEDRESSEAALTREIKEETGIEVNIIEHVYSKRIHFVYDPPWCGRYFAADQTTDVFLCSPQGGRLIQEDEGDPEEESLPATWHRIDELKPEMMQSWWVLQSIYAAKAAFDARFAPAVFIGPEDSSPAP
ncbi:MAG: NUDIX domain-containing protein [Candidatus Uhrbacteria bacterium]|nr:NUDIX domain-containing protein [Patescibacteria group bacterium]MBU1907263.1 NUDIX domain-containing protein [Patescibacteria group bacterium]